MRPQKRDSAATLSQPEKGIGVSKIERSLLDRRVDFSLPLLDNFDRGVLLGKSVIIGNTVICQTITLFSLWFQSIPRIWASGRSKRG